MKAFAALFTALDATTSSRRKVELLQAYFAAVPPADAAWALALLLGRRRRRLISGRRLREVALAAATFPDWLFEACHSQVGDSAETVALLWQQVVAAAVDASGLAVGSPLPPCSADAPLATWMEQWLPALAALQGDVQAQALQDCWRQLPPELLLVLNKLLSGGFRVGVSSGLVTRALACQAHLEEAVLAHRLMGGFQPSAAAWQALLAPVAPGQTAATGPYPFFLASPLEPTQLHATDPSHWGVEWKWDGIRGQLLHRHHACSLWSRGEELINDAFPELVALAATLPVGSVLDGEVIIWRAEAERPEPFAQLQRRLGRQAPSQALQHSCPAAFVAYDLLELHGDDQRSLPLHQRRDQLERLHQHWQAQQGEGPLAGRLRLSPLQPLGAWSALDGLRQQARHCGAEGLMLKALGSPYGHGRRRGHWWKYKLEPYRLDAVLLYAQPGRGRRANLYTDYSFGLWNEAGELVTFAKAYSGLDDGEIRRLDRWIRAHTTERFGPVRAVAPLQVFELAFEGLQLSRRHRSGIAVRFPRIQRWREDKPACEADTLATALALLAAERDRPSVEGPSVAGPL